MIWPEQLFEVLLLIERNRFMSTPNPYDNYSQNPEWQNDQIHPPSQPAIPPTQYQPSPANQPPPQYQQPVYQPAPQYQQPGYYPPPQYQQPGYYQPPGVYAPFGMPVAPLDRRGGFAIAGLVLGIVGIVVALVPVCGLPVSIVGIVMSALGRQSVLRRTMAGWGLALSIIGLVLTVLIFIVFAMAR